MVITLFLSCVCVGVRKCWKVWGSVHVFPGDAVKCTVQLHVYEYLSIHINRIRAVHQG